jgi:peptidyl-prolyl cis-trans isomerase D
VVFEPGRYQDIEVTDEEVQEYFDANQNNYKTELKLKAQYIYFNPQDFAGGVTVAVEDVKDYFDSHPDEFIVPKTVKARHILFKLEKDSSPEVVEEKRKKAEEVLALAKGGEDFGELAKTYSEGPSKDRGGDLGTFKKETMVKPFADQAFSMKAGEISDPVRTQFGWHIIKV